MSVPTPTPFAWDLPGGARIVALVFQPSEAERSATAVDAIATSIARRRGPTLLLNAEAEPSPLDDLASASERAESGGMAAFLAGQAALARIAVRRADSPYAYLPAGNVPEGVAGLLESAALERFVARVKEAEGTLFIAMSDRARPSDGLLDLLDGYLAVGRIPPREHGLRCYGHVPFESSGPDVGSESAPTLDPASPPALEPTPESAPEPDPAPAPEPMPAPEPTVTPESDPAIESVPTPGATRGRRPRGPLVAVLVIAALAVGNWWAYRNGWFDRAISRVGSLIAAAEETPATPLTPADGSTAGPADPLQPEDPSQAAGTPEAPPPADTPSDDAPADDSQPDDPPQPPDETAVVSAFESAAERPYSVLLGSFRDPAEAAVRLAEIRALHGDVLYVTVPTTVREVGYRRVLAGALATEEEAAALMEELVAAGVADEATAWLLRPVRFAYDLGVFAERSGMEARIAELAALGIPAYSLETALDGMPVFRVYAGAYENEAAAAPMREALEAAGQTATLIARRGDAVPSAP